MKSNKPMPHMLSKKDKNKSILRLLNYVFKYYKWHFLIVMICIIFSKISNVIGSLYVGSVLVQGFITPALKIAAENNLDSAYELVIGPNKILWHGISLNVSIIIVGLTYIVGIVSNYFYMYLMSYIGQGTQKRIRDELYSHMQLEDM